VGNILQHYNSGVHSKCLYAKKEQGRSRLPVLRSMLHQHGTLLACLCLTDSVLLPGFFEALLHMLLYAYKGTKHCSSLPVSLIAGLLASNAITPIEGGSFSAEAYAAGGWVGGRLNSAANIACWHAGPGQAGSVG
jgi:hypothetical protein